jgi:toxin ParE1/3/4
MQKYELIVSDFAEIDLKEIITFFSDKNIQYSIELYKKIKIRIDELEVFPERGKVVPELEKQGINKYRQVIEGNYRIIYSIKNTQVNILMIVDSRRNLEELLFIKLLKISE